MQQSKEICLLYKVFKIFMIFQLLRKFIIEEALTLRVT